MQCTKCKMMVPAGASHCAICKTKVVRASHTAPAPIPQAQNLSKKSASAKVIGQQTKPVAPTTPKATDLSSQGPLKDLLHAGGILDQKFKLNQEIGRGGMGFVYLATDLSLNRQVAVKILPPHYNDDQSIVKRFQREARAMAALDHINIVTVYSIGFFAGLHYFVMKFLKGETLAHVIKRVELNRRPTITALEVIDLMIQTCNGLEHAHNRNLLHRDIKPGNLMLSPEGLLSIMDFGIVKRLDDSDSVGLKTAHGKIFGTPEYMPPEQAMGKGHYSPASDLYALAVVGYELLCGELPYVAETPIGIIIQHIRADVPKLKGQLHDQYPVLESILRKCLSKEPELRYSSATDLRTALMGAQLRLSPPQLQAIEARSRLPSDDENFDFIDDIDSLELDDMDFFDSGLDLDTGPRDTQSPISKPTIPNPVDSSKLDPSTPIAPPTIGIEPRPTASLKPASSRPGHYKGLPFKRK